jgi:hypothetical protein
MRARSRDAIVVAVFALGAVLVRLAWHPLGPWVALVIAFATALIAVGVYRMRPTSHAAEDGSRLVLRGTDGQ